MKRFVRRHQPRPCRGCSLKAGIAAALALGMIAMLGENSGTAMLIAPFGASAVLLFAVHDSPLSQPVNVVGGHVLAAGLALLLDPMLPDTSMSMVLAVGLTIVAMSVLRLVHPPAGAMPLIIMTQHPDASFLLPVGIGAVGLVTMACILHRIPPVRVAYPLPPK